MNKFLRTVLPPLIPFVIFTLGAEFAVRLGWMPDWLLPSPTQVIRSIGKDGSELFQATLSTAIASLIGFAISSVVGIFIAIVLASGGYVQRAFYPYAVFFQTVPIIAIAPLLVIWFDFSIKAVVASSFIVSVFPVIANTLTGLLSTETALKDMFALYGAGSAATLLKLRLPFALPNIFTGLRIAAGLSVIGTIVGEFITGTGLGGLIQVARQQQRVDKVFAVLLLSSILGIVLFGSINLISKLSLRNWHASEGER